MESRLRKAKGWAYKSVKYQIITFYEFKKLKDLAEIRAHLKGAMEEFSVFGTFIIAEEGFNSTVCGEIEAVKEFIPRVESIFGTTLKFKSSFHEAMAFKRQKVKIKKEIVTLRKDVDLSKGIGTHVKSRDWNQILSDPDTIILDTRNDYEFRVGTFKNAINPGTASFNELPDFIEKNLDPKRDKKIAMFCTGGIRCEKFAPYMKDKGFEEVFQLEGGILRYLEEIPDSESLWEGECFVFDERISVDENLEKGSAADLSVSKD
ncbi:MAG: rhodanese-related sulfurtransferase, partial [Acidobacteria bacterium]|nr:rhodanese-related sulfurtransferase [Acidobacteriota bacterium]